MLRRGLFQAFQSRCASALASQPADLTHKWDDVPFDSEHKKILKKVRALVGKSDETAHETGALKTGREFCKMFGIEGPKTKISKNYMDIMRDFAPFLLEKYRLQELGTRKYVESEFTSFKRTSVLEAKNEEFFAKMDKYLVLDFETTTVEEHKRKASPFSDKNRIVYTAYEFHDGEATVQGPFSSRNEYQATFPSLKDVNVIVGHNLKFDLLYIWDDEEIRDFFKKGGLIWDTMYAEYLIEGHADGVRLRLDDVSLTYGGTQKDDYIKEQWDKGIDTADIDKSKMIEYAKNDVINTKIVFQAQKDLLYKSCRIPMVVSHNEGLLATTDMEFNGVFVDNDVTSAQNDDLIQKIEVAEKELAALHTPEELVKFNKQHAADMVGEPAEFNWGSVTQLRAYLYGGKVKYSIKVSDKSSGKEKIRRKNEEVLFKGIVPKDWMEKNEYFYASDGTWAATDKIIEAIADSFERESWAQAISHLRYIKKMKKLSVYLSSFMQLQDQNRVMHPSLNHTVTRTGRLSAANPNMQNVPRGKGVKECLTTRFKNGRMLESDYSQLEVFVLALLSQDKNLCEELTEGTDLHCKRLARIRNKDYKEVVQLCKVDKVPEWEEARTKAKIFQFQRQYGAGSASLSRTTGLPVSEIERMIKVEQEAYPDVENFFVRVKKSCIDSCQKTGEDRGFFDSPTGNRWYFQYQKRSFGKFSSSKKDFKKQALLNYPVQGFAAEIVLVCLGKLWRHFLSKGNYSVSGDFSTPARALLVNTVHDCVWVDADAEVVDVVKQDVEEILSSVREAFSEHGYLIENWLEFRTDTEIGENMASLH
eukprot:TRINITY_DN9852_c0_g1_i1.p1 TRINITY_DN9852_c0_g1~~TRINITY_DN9852_c0_g1_i1.p1  ORF type:complete len:816 (+),score=150.67 TRINITY_DN9852_c0_g1_i1:130-2577(+)